MTTASDGFTLIETLVAMAVLAVAATGLVRATQGHVDLIGRVEARVAGGWAADNALVETRLGLAAVPESLLARDWRVSVAARPSDDPEVAALTVTATSPAASVAIAGFADAGPRAATSRPAR